MEGPALGSGGKAQAPQYKAQAGLQGNKGEEAGLVPSAASSHALSTLSLQNDTIIRHTTAPEGPGPGAKASGRGKMLSWERTDRTRQDLRPPSVLASRRRPIISAPPWTPSESGSSAGLFPTRGTAPAACGSCWTPDGHDRTPTRTPTGRNLSPTHSYPRCAAASRTSGSNSKPSVRPTPKPVGSSPGWSSGSRP
jgi:hypothetical protein